MKAKDEKFNARFDELHNRMQDKLSELEARTVILNQAFNDFLSITVTVKRDALDMAHVVGDLSVEAHEEGAKRFAYEAAKRRTVAFEKAHEQIVAALNSFVDGLSTISRYQDAEEQLVMGTGGAPDAEVPANKPN